MSGLVSIIIPVYNLEKYIQFNIDNMLSQTYENIEVIYVDDGSADSSAQIIKSAAEKDSRIKYYYKENGGVSSARNFGLEKANGEYIMFVDGDDYLHLNAVEILFDALTSNNADISCCQFKETYSLDEYKNELSLQSALIYDFNRLPDEKDEVIFVTACTKMIKKELMADLKFPTEITIGEDRYFMLILMDRIKKLAYIPTPLYFYYQRQGSAVHGDHLHFLFSVAEAIDKALSKVNKSKPYVYAYALETVYKFIAYYRIDSSLADDKNEDVASGRRKAVKIGRKQMKELLGCRALGKKRFIYCLFFYCLPAHKLYRRIIGSQ